MVENDGPAPDTAVPTEPPAATVSAIQAAFAAAVARHQGGDGAAAARLYRQVLTLRADIPQAFNNLGAVSLDLGRATDADWACRRALALDPTYAQAYYNLGNALQAQGHATAAVTAYRRAITLKADYPLAHYNRGDALRAADETQEAIAAYRQALTLKPDFAEAYGNLGVALYDGEDFTAAETAYRRALALRPLYPQALDNLGNVLLQLSQLDAAVSAHGRAIAVQPGQPGPYCNLGNALSAREDFEDAIAAYQRALALDPDYGAALINLGNALREQGRFDEAQASYRRAIAIKPDFAEAYSNLGLAFYDSDDYAHAAIACQQAIAFRPHYPEAHNNLGSALQALRRLDDALVVCRRAIRLKPDFLEARLNMCGAFTKLGRIDQALATYQEAVALRPHHALSHFGYGMTLLKLGRYREGWAEYEWRWKIPKFEAQSAALTQPRWAGEPLDGQTILLSGEQGLGDALQFVRYAPLVAARGGRVVLRVRTPLVRLFRSVAGVADVFTIDATPPAYDCHLPLMSVPWAIGTTLDDVPATVPYLHPDPAAVARWRDRLAEQTGDRPGGRTVGLVWAGDARPFDRHSYRVDLRRSLHLDRFAPLAGIPGLTLVSLQKGPPARQLLTPPEGLRLLNYMDEMYDFADTAALVAALDLVIAADTAVAHLAGALGKPVWILSRFDNCWRWLHQRDDTPWYPTARLFRQLRPGDWDAVVAHLKVELLHWMATSPTEGLIESA